MSGSFFRGTSADQDTRFSNKQVKLLKSQKFPAELDHLVDMTKVKMDVIRPWIATRTTELLGFEDEVIINFVYGLLEGKAVDGKQIQIQLTGFMEKNTWKFMKELWGLLLSAQNNASGVPQQFLDAKEEEMKKKKMETDRITQEITKRKERVGCESEQDRKIRTDGLKEAPRNAIPNSVSARSPIVEPTDEREVGRKDGSRRKSRSSHSPARSSSKSFSKSRSYSEERHSSRSPSVSPRHQRCSVSRDRRYRSPSKHFVSPRQIYRSPSRRRSPHFRWRSISRSRYKSPSPVRCRTPERWRSTSTVRRRTSERQRSPLHHQFRSPPPTRRRSPTTRSPVYSRRKSPSPLQHRYPANYRTSTRCKSPSPELKRSPSFRSSRRWSQSPARRKMDSNSPRHMNRNRSSPSSQSPNQRRRSRDDNRNRSPPVRSSDKKQVKLSYSGQREVDSISNKNSISLRSPHRDTKASENERRDDADHKKCKYSPVKVSDKYSPEEVEAHRSSKREETSIDMEKKNGQRSRNVNPSERPSNQHSSMLEDIKNSPPKLSRESSLSSPERGVSPQYRRQSNQQSLLKSPSLKEGRFIDDKKQMYEKKNEYNSDIELNVEANDNIEDAVFHSDSKDDSRFREREMGDAKRSNYDKERRDAKDGSKMDERQSKRRKKDERRLRKEEKRRKREERHRRKEERRAGKKFKCVDTVNPPSDNDRGHLIADDTDGEARTRSTYRSDMDDAESRQKNFEIKLREKALESLRAKKAVNH